MNEHDEHYAGLRRWAAGDRCTEAATELLIRTGWAAPWRPWVHAVGPWAWIDFLAVGDNVGALSSGERRLLLLAASIGGPTDCTVALGDAVTGIDSQTMRLVLSAVAHAAGLNRTGEADGWPL